MFPDVVDENGVDLNSQIVIEELEGVDLPATSRAIAERIADGDYTWENQEITGERFSLTLPEGPRRLFTVCFGVELDGITPARQWARANGYASGLIDELLAVGSNAGYQDLQRKCQIFAPGHPSVYRVPFLDGNDVDRDLNLMPNDAKFPSTALFLFSK